MSHEAPAPAPEQLSDAALHAVLRSAPGRRAPATLAPAVLHAIRARASLPWWRRPYTAWPAAARHSAVAGAAGAVLLLTLYGPAAARLLWAQIQVPAALEALLRAAGSAAEALATHAAGRLQEVPVWAWGAAAVAFVCSWTLCIGGLALATQLAAPRRRSA